MSGKITVNRDILFFAFRYSLGRMSTAPSIVMDAIKANLNEISNTDLMAYMKEIKDCESLGMAIDKKAWADFTVFLEEELGKRLSR